MITPNPKPPKGSGRLTRRLRKAEATQAMLDAYAEVDARDAGFCRATGRYTQPGGVDPAVRREHHHLQPRSVRPDLIAEAKNIILVAAEVHALITGGFIEVEGKDATKPLFFHWNAAAMKGRIKPFRLISRRSVA